MWRKRITLFATVTTMLVTPILSAQTISLNKRISLDLPSCSLEVALAEIGKAGNFRFSYDAELIPGEKQIKVKVKDVPVGRLLKELLGPTVNPKEVGNHVILVRNRQESKEWKPYREIIISGKVLDAATKRPLVAATVYEIENKKSAITDLQGNYKIALPTGKKVRSLSFCKAAYGDTVIFIRQAVTTRVDLFMRPLFPERIKMERFPGTVSFNPTDSMGLVRWLVPNETMVNSNNLEVKSPRTFQVSLIPYIGTNWKVTGSIVNRFSFNILAGYTGGLQGVELGGLLNITRNEISGWQIGGLGNIVGGRGKGWQIGGLFNFDMGRFEGVQIGGLFNYAPDTIVGVQISGLTNIITGKIKGVQISGLTNIVTKNSDGWLLSGLLNLTLKESRKVQITGLVNYCDNSEGLQLAGLVNISRRYNSGVQIAGLVNYATTLHGLQLGVVNVCNTVEKGVPIGLFSYVQEGYHLFEVSGNEIFYLNVAFRSGTRSFYNFVQAGIGSDYKVQGSYGIGTIFTLKRKWSMNLDASAGFVYHPVGTEYHGLLLKVNPAVEHRFAKHFGLFLGPAYNCFVFSKGAASATPRGLSTYDFYFSSTQNASIQMWIGGVLGIRL